MKWEMQVNTDPANYWDTLYGPANPDGADPPYVVCTVNGEAFIAPNDYLATHDQDVGPFESVEMALTAVKILNAQEGYIE